MTLRCHQQLHPESENSLKMKKSRSKEGLAGLAAADDTNPSLPFLQYLKLQLEKAVRVSGNTPVPVVIGAHGKAGSGAVACARQLGLRPAEWTRSDTNFAQLLEFDLLVNAVRLKGPMGPFLTPEAIRSRDRTLGVIVDVSCDVYNPLNPLPIYHSTTSFAKPTQRFPMFPKILTPQAHRWIFSFRLNRH